MSVFQRWVPETVIRLEAGASYEQYASSQQMALKRVACVQYAPPPIRIVTHKRQPPLGRRQVGRAAAKLQLLRPPAARLDWCAESRTRSATAEGSHEYLRSGRYSIRRLRPILLLPAYPSIHQHNHTPPVQPTGASKSRNRIWGLLKSRKYSRNSSHRGLGC